MAQKEVRVILEAAENKNDKIFEEKALLTVKDMCKYMSIGESTASSLLSMANCPFVFRLRGRIYANKKVLDKWIEQNTGR